MAKYFKCEKCGKILNKNAPKKTFDHVKNNCDVAKSRVKRVGAEATRRRNETFIALTLMS